MQQIRLIFMKDTNAKAFREYLLRNKISGYAFIKLSGLSSLTVYRLINGTHRAYKKTAKRICEVSNGELTLEDFGYSECNNVIIKVKQDGEK